MISRAS